MKLILEADRIIAEATDEYTGPQSWMEAPASYVAGSFRLPGTEPEFPRLSSLDMLDLFTEAEQLAVVEATLVSAPVKLWYDRLLAAEYITYADPRTDAGLQALVEAGLLTAERNAQIAAAMQAQAGALTL